MPPWVVNMNSGLLDPAIEREREVVLLRDLGRLLDPETLDDVALDVEADDVLRVLLRLVRVGRELDAACLAAAAGEHLGLDDDRAAEHLGSLPRLARRRRQPTFADGDPDPPEQLLALVFVEIHSAPSLPTRFAAGRSTRISSQFQTLVDKPFQNERGPDLRGPIRLYVRIVSGIPGGLVLQYRLLKLIQGHRPEAHIAYGPADSCPTIPAGSNEGLTFV